MEGAASRNIPNLAHLKVMLGRIAMKDYSDRKRSRRKQLMVSAGIIGQRRHEWKTKWIFTKSDHRSPSS